MAGIGATSQNLKVPRVVVIIVNGVIIDGCTSPKPRQILEGDGDPLQTQSSSSQNGTCCAKCGILASAKCRDLSPRHVSIDLANALLSISIKTVIEDSLHSVGMRCRLPSE